MTWKPDAVLYHGNCDDGFGAAFAAWKRWGADGIEYMPCHYGMPNPAAHLRNKHVLMVDFSFKVFDMRMIAKFVKSMVVLDHHISAQDELWEWGPNISFRHYANSHEDTQHCLPIVAVFDMKKSGARMAWEFCHPGTSVPKLIAHIEDRDLWRFNIFGTAEISAAIGTYPQDFEVWSAFSEDTLYAEGKTILRGHQKNIESMLRNIYKDEIDGVCVPILNVPYHYASDCADAILKQYPDAPFAATWFQRGDGIIKYSLRSRDDRMDVSEIAKKFGGGGHRNAAGFQIEAPSRPALKRALP